MLRFKKATILGTRSGVGCMGGLGGRAGALPHSNRSNGRRYGTVRRVGAVAQRGGHEAGAPARSVCAHVAAPLLRDVHGLTPWHGGRVPRRHAATSDPMGRAFWRAARYAPVLRDSDSESLDAVSMSTDSGDGLPPAASVQIQLFRPQEYRAAHPQLFRAISRRWLYNIPRSLKTEGVRPLGMLAFLDHYEQLSRTLYAKLAELVKRSNEDQHRSTDPIRIYVISGAHGGTGGAILIEIGYLIREILRQLNWRNYRLSGNLSAATTLAANLGKISRAIGNTRPSRTSKTWSRRL